MVGIEYMILPSLFIFTFAICTFINRRAYFCDLSHLHRMGYMGTASYSMAVLGGMGGLNEVVLMWYQSSAYLLALLVSYASNLVFGYYIIPALDFRMRRARSLGDVLYAFYGRTVELVFSSILVVFCLTIMATFLSLACLFINAATGISFAGSLAAISILLAIQFWISGGTEVSVCYDLKLLVIGCILAAVAALSLSQTIGDSFAVANHLRLPDMQHILSFCNEYRDILACVICLSVLSSIIHPPTLQYLLEIGSVQHMARANIVNAALKALAILTIWLIISPRNNGLISATSVPLFLSTLPSPFRVLSVFAVLTLMISQIYIYGDSAVLLYWRNIMGQKEEDKNYNHVYPWLYGIAIALACIGIHAIILGLALQLVLLAFLPIPLLLSLLHWRVSEKIFWCSGIANALLFSGLWASRHLTYTTGLMAFGISASLTAVMCCFSTKGFVMVSQRLYKDTEVWFYPTPHTANNPVNSIYNILHGLALNFKASLQQEAHHNIRTYRNFGIICLAIYLIPYSIWSHIGQPHILFFINIRLLCCLLSLGLILAQFWPGQTKKTLLPIYWYLTVLLSMPFAEGLSLAASGPDNRSLNLAIFFLLTGCVLKPKAFWIINLSGMLTGVAVYQAIFHDIIWYKDMGTGYLILQNLMLPLLCGGFISYMTRSVQYEASIGMLPNYADLLNRLEYAMAGACYADMLSPNKNAVLGENLSTITQEFIEHLPGTNTSQNASVTDTSIHSLSECLNKAIAQYRHKITKPIAINKYVVGNIFFKGQFRELQYALHLLLYQVSLYNPEISVIEIWNENRKLYICASRDEIIVGSICRYLMTSTGDIPAAIKMSTLLCRLVMGRINGTFSYNSDENSILLTFTFPKALQ